MNTRWYKGILCGLILLLPAVLAAQSAANQIIIVKSSDNAYFNQTIETLINHIDQTTRFKVVMARDLTASFEDSGQKNLYIALGQPAVEAINELGSGISSVNAYLTNEQFQRLDLEDQVTILLDQPLHRYLAFCKLMLTVDSIGIITDQRVRLEHHQLQLLAALKLELNQYQVDPENKLLPVLRRLLLMNDALLMLPQQSIFNRDTLKGVLLTSYRSRKPAISYSPAHVKSGAIASIYSSPTDIGRHLAIRINQKLQNPSSKEPAHEYARFYSIATNGKVARSLGINLPGENEIRGKLDRLDR